MTTNNSNSNPTNFNAPLIFDILCEYITHRNDLSVQNSNGVSLDAQDILWGFIHGVEKSYSELKACYRTMPRSGYRVLSDAVKFRDIIKEISRSTVRGRSWDVASLDLIEPNVARDIVELVMSEIETSGTQKVLAEWGRVEPAGISFSSELSGSTISPSGWDCIEPRSKDDEIVNPADESDEDDDQIEGMPTLADLDGSWEEFGKQQEDDDSIPEGKSSDIPDEMVWDADVTRIVDFGTQEYAYLMTALRFLNSKTELPELLEISTDEIKVRAINAGAYEKIVGETIHELRMRFKPDYEIVPLYEKLVTGAMVIIARRLQYPDAVAYTVSFR